MGIDRDVCALYLQYLFLPSTAIFTTVVSVVTVDSSSSICLPINPPLLLFQPTLHHAPSACQAHCKGPCQWRCHRAAGDRAEYPRPVPHLPSRYSSTGDREWREYGSKGRCSDQGSTAAAVYECKGVKEGKGAKGAKGVITALALLLKYQWYSKIKILSFLKTS